MTKELLTLKRAIDSTFSTKKLTLYKYVTPSALDGLIRNGDIKLTYRKDANDPFECLPSGDIKLDAALGDIGIISFTKNNCNHPMWGNYADHFRGACIEFNIDYFFIEPGKEAENIGEKLALEGIEQKQRGTSVYFFQYWENGNDAEVDRRGGDVLLKCNYSNDRSPRNKTEFKIVPLYRCNTQNPRDLLHENVNEYRQRLWREVSTKHKDWEYEEEFRVTMRDEGITRRETTKDNITIHLTNRLTCYISRIILGPFSNLSVNEVKEKIENIRATGSPSVYLPENVKIVKASLKPDSFDLEIPEYEN